MKIRTGYVSNSSSSSFIVAYKIKPTKKDLIDKIFKVDENSVFYDMAWKMAEILLDVEPADSEWGCYDDEIIDKLKKQGFEVFEGAAGSDGEAEEAMLCEMDIDYHDDNLVIKKDGGY